MNSDRKLYVLFRTTYDKYIEYKDIVAKAGYVLIHKHTFLNDEPPYIMVTYWGKGKIGTWYDDEYDTHSYYLIREDQASVYIKLKKEEQDDYNGWYYEGMLLKAHESSPLSPREHAAEHHERLAKIKVLDEYPHKVDMMLT